MTRAAALALILMELEKAEHKHPKWPENRLRQAVVVAEEAGEALKEALGIIEFEEKVSTPDRRMTGYEVTLDYNKLEQLEEQLVKEMAQTGAMALRWLMNWAPLYAKSRPEPPAP